MKRELIEELARKGYPVVVQLSEHHRGVVSGESGIAIPLLFEGVITGVCPRKGRQCEVFIRMGIGQTVRVLARHVLNIRGTKDLEDVSRVKYRRRARAGASLQQGEIAI